MSTPRPARFIKRRPLKNKKKLRRIARKANTGTAVHGSSRILLDTFIPLINVNHPANPDNSIKFQIYSVVPSKIDELTSRTVIYSKFRIRYVKYTLVRDGNPKFSQQLASYSFAGGANTGMYGYMFPNTFNRLLPTITGTNSEAILNWCMQQTGAKRFTVHTQKISKKIPPKLTINDEYQGPSSGLPGASVIINRNVKCPWLDLNNDLLDNISLGQMVIAQPAVDVATTAALSTATGAAGLSALDVQEFFRYRVYADVGYSVKGRWLDRIIV